MSREEQDASSGPLAKNGFTHLCLSFLFWQLGLAIFTSICEFGCGCLCRCLGAQTCISSLLQWALCRPQDTCSDRMLFVQHQA